ncbi:uncharacterized protein LOC133796235 [Humulus lupulus]|uniref:uncharacterized protein LOC133796235 n=1 Tax=Humulus lupulus TaxID=3486 RepID=UPI002B415EAC|nr:uncharacterized protein LOC133796235 [Humulus lupulus]
MSSSNRGSRARSSGRMTYSSSDDGSCTIPNIPIGVVRIGVDYDEPIVGGFSGRMLLGSNPKSKITLKDLPRLHQAYDIPSYASLHAPSGGERANWNLPGWVCMYDLPFKEGFRFPLPMLAKEVWEYHLVSPSQLMPNVWHALMAMEVFSEKYAIEFTVEEVLRAYSLKEHHTDKGRYQFLSKLKSSLIVDLKDCDKHWKDRYFFVSHNVLGLPADCKIPHGWSSASRVNLLFAWVCREAQGRVDRFVEFREEDRRWQAILSDLNLRGSSLWSQVPHHPEGFGAMERLQARKKQAIAASSAEKDVFNEFVEKIELSFSSSASTHSEFGPHLEEVNKLLWPKDKDRFDQLGSKSSLSASISHAFQGMQGLMWANEKIQEFEKQVKRLNCQNVDLRSEVRGLKTCKKVLEKLNGELKTQLDVKELDASRLQPTLATLANVQAKVDMLEGRLTNIALEAEIQCRGQMAIDFRDGKADSWNVTQFIADYEELQQMRVEEAIQANNLAISFGDMTTGALGQKD